MTKFRAIFFHDQRGFTLVELLVVMAITGVLLTLSAGAIRHYWLVQSLDSATDEIVSQLRRAQSRTTSESNPLVYGLRFRAGSPSWDVVRYDPGTSVAPTRPETCRYEDRNELGGGVVVLAPVSVAISPTAPELVACKAQLNGALDTDTFVFFYARGTATAMNDLAVHHPTLGSARNKTIDVTALTGRVTRS